MFNDFWMSDHGFREDQPFGDLRDLIARPFAKGDVVSLAPDDPATVAYSRMRLYDVSQLAVIENGGIVGIVDESDLLLAVHDNPIAFGSPVREFMTSKLQTVSRSLQIRDLMPIFDSGHVAIVSDELGFHGLITQIDVLNYLRRQQQTA
jgi:cystathionine beta-synthase